MPGEPEALIQVGEALLGDGAVRFISENIDQATLNSITSTRGGEVIGEF